MVVEKKKISAFRNVGFRIELSKGEANCHTINRPQTINTNPAQEPISDRLNRTYKEMLHGRLAEKRQRENGVFDMVGAIKKHSMKRKAECSILKRKSTMKKQKNNYYCKREVKKFLCEATSNLMNRNVKHKNKVQQIVGGLVDDNDRASNGSNGGSNEGGSGRRDDSGRI